MTAEQRLANLGIILPAAAKAVANYVGWVKSGNLVFISGQLALVQGVLMHPGLVGGNVSIDDAKAAARLCAVNIIAQARDACGGDLERVSRVLKLTGFVAADSTFTQHPAIVNGASDLMVECFGEAGRHARAAVGVSSLPLGACVEVEAVFEIKG